MSKAMGLAAAAVTQGQESYQRSTGAVSTGGVNGNGRRRAVEPAGAGRIVSPGSK
jgi:hypothetical protein